MIADKIDGLVPGKPGIGVGRPEVDIIRAMTEIEDGIGLGDPGAGNGDGLEDEPVMAGTASERIAAARAP